MPLYDYKCLNEDCRTEFEESKKQDDCYDPAKCPSCGDVSKRVVSSRQSQPTFSEQLFPFYHIGFGEVVNSESDMNRKCEAAGLFSKHEGAHMTRKQEKMLMDKRIHRRPRETVEKVKWSGKGANMPTIETSDMETIMEGRDRARHSENKRRIYV